MIYIIVGLARSGKSMFMQMLHAGGIELSWDKDYIRPNGWNERGFFEHENPGDLLCDPDFRKSIDGQAINLVAPQILFIPFASRKDMKVIWVQRSFKKVLSSLLRIRKRLCKLGRDKPYGKEEWREVIADLRTQLNGIRGEINTFHSHIIVDYDEALRVPRDIARQLAEFVERPFDIDAAAAAPEARLCHN